MMEASQPSQSEIKELLTMDVLQQYMLDIRFL